MNAAVDLHSVQTLVTHLLAPCNSPCGMGTQPAGLCCSASAQSPEARQSPGASSSMQSPTSSADSAPGSHRDRESPGSVSLQMKQQYSIANQRTPPTPDVRLYHRAVVVAQDTPGTHIHLLL